MAPIIDGRMKSSWKDPVLFLTLSMRNICRLHRTTGAGGGDDGGWHPLEKTYVAGCASNRWGVALFCALSGRNPSVGAAALFP